MELLSMSEKPSTLSHKSNPECVMKRFQVRHEPGRHLGSKYDKDELDPNECDASGDP